MALSEQLVFTLWCDGLLYTFLLYTLLSLLGGGVRTETGGSSLSGQSIGEKFVIAVG